MQPFFNGYVYLIKLKLSSAYRGYIGVGKRNIKFQDEVSELQQQFFYDSVDGYSYRYSKSGKYHAGEKVNYGEEGMKNDILLMEFDLIKVREKTKRKGSLSYHRNGKYLGVAYETRDFLDGPFFLSWSHNNPLFSSLQLLEIKIK